MPDDPLEGLAIDDGDTPSGGALPGPTDPLADLEVTETGDFNRMQPTAGQGMRAVPEGMRETGARVFVAPETEISVDPTGQRPDVVRERGEFTEFRHVQPPAPPEPSGWDRLLSGFERFAREAGRVGPGSAAIGALGRIDPVVAAESFARAPLHGFADEALGALGALGAQTGRRAAEIAPGAMRAIGEATDAPRIARDLDRLGVLPMPDASADPASAYRDLRDRFRAREARQREQDPGSALAGDIAYAAPTLAIPGAQSSALARIATMGGLGLASGATRGAGESTAEDLGGVALDAGTGAVLEGTAGAALTGGGELAGRGLRRLAQWAARGGDRAARGAVQSRLEASGAWGGRAMRAAEEMPGGQEAVAADFRRLGIGHGVGDPARLAEARATGEPVSRGWFPRSTRTADDAAQVMRDAGARMDDVLARMDEAASAPMGAREGRPSGMVDLARVADELDTMAAELERMPVGTGPRVAQRIRAEFVEPLRERGGVSFRDAHALRRFIDRTISQWRADPNIVTPQGLSQTARRAVSRAMDDAAESVDPALRQAWREANRDYSVGAFADEFGRGAERLSVQGGMGGADAAGELIASHLPGGALVAPIGREAAQQQRMIWPGVRARALEALAPRLRALGGAQGARWAARLEQAARRGQTALAAAHYALTRTDPGYRSTVEQMQEQE